MLTQIVDGKPIILIPGKKKGEYLPKIPDHLDYKQSQTARHYHQAMVKKTVGKHQRIYMVIHTWLDHAGKDTIETLQDLDMFLDFLLSCCGAHWWKTSKVNEYRVAMEHWLNINSPKGFDFSKKAWEYRWDGLWYHQKINSGKLYPEDKATIRGVIDKEDLKLIIDYILDHHEVCGTRAPDDVIEALTVILGCCLRLCEFTDIWVGDWDPVTKYLILRHNKGMTVKNGNESNIYFQRIKVIDEDAIEVLTKRQKRLKSRLTAYDAKVAAGATDLKPPLLFTWSEIPGPELSPIIQKVVKNLPFYNAALQWCAHSLRHGGAQTIMARYENSLITMNPIPKPDMISAIHMARDTYDKVYGVSTKQREVTASRRGKRTRDGRPTWDDP